MIKGLGGLCNLVPPTLGAVTEPSVVMYHFGATLFYANANLFADEVSRVVGPSPSPVRWLIVDAEAITHVDYTAARVLRELIANLNKSGVVVAFVRMPWGLTSDFDRHHLTELIGSDHMYNHIHDAIDAFRASQHPQDPR